MISIARYGKFVNFFWVVVPPFSFSLLLWLYVIFGWLIFILFIVEKTREKRIGTFEGVMAIVGAMIGAGFASGKEIWVFFARFGWVAILSVVPLGILLFFCFFVGLESFKLNSKMHKKMQFLLQIGMFFCHFCLLSAMIAGLKLLCFGMGAPWLFLIVFCIIGVLLFFGATGIFKAMGVFVPVLIVFLVACCGYFVFCFPTKFEHTTMFGSFYICLNLVLYVCMNVLTALPILEQLGKSCANKKGIAFVASICICALFLLLLVCMIMFGNDSVEMPVLFLCAQQNAFLGTFCFFVLLVASATTLLSCGMEVVDMLEKKIGGRWICVCLALGLATAVSCLGFGKIVTFLYPALGVVGAIEIVVLGVLALRNKNNLKNS